MKIVRVILAIVAASFTVHGAANAAKPEKIERRVAEAKAEFVKDIGGGQAVLDKAVGLLWFPLIRKGGIGIGGEYGQGALQINGKTVAYYSTASASIGFQLGGQSRRQLIAFFDQAALDKFRNSDGWEIGVDASVAVITLGAGGSIDTTELSQPVAAFIWDNKGAMYNLSLEGSKISRIHDD